MWNIKCLSIREIESRGFNIISYDFIMCAISLTLFFSKNGCGTNIKGKLNIIALREKVFQCDINKTCNNSDKYDYYWLNLDI